MTFDLIISQGRVADRHAGTIEGAAHLGQALEQRFRKRSTSVGKPAPPAEDDWRISLPQAQDTIVGLRRVIAGSMEGGNVPVVVANTCSASLASLPVVARSHPEAVVLWIDAHGDFNTPETTETGYLGGMVLSAACGLWDSGHGSGLRPPQVILIGARDIDRPEGELLRESGVHLITPEKATSETVVNAIGDRRVWIHVDWDVLEPGNVPADFAVPGGLSAGTLRKILEAVPAAQLIGLELAEFHAPADRSECNQAVATIIEIVAPLLERMASNPTIAVRPAGASFGGL